MAYDVGVVVNSFEDLLRLRKMLKGYRLSGNLVKCERDTFEFISAAYGLPLVFYVDSKHKEAGEFDRPEHVICPVMEANINSKIYKTYEEYERSKK